MTGGERISTICSAVLTQYRGLRLPAGNEQSRRRTDGRNCYINFALAFTNDSERPIKICPVHDTYLCVNHNLLTIKLGTLSLYVIKRKRVRDEFERFQFHKCTGSLCP